ncbi:MAG: uncharacterized protein PWP60_748 [Candidatus Atribacteria bacterium]|nr:uncharacterized protein [Candidatus Atribacteria bacterium]
MAKKRRIPLRMCVGCRERKPKKELIRIVKTPQGELLVDDTGKKAGRGAYVCPKPECVAGINLKGISQALKTECSQKEFQTLIENLKKHLLTNSLEGKEVENAQNKDIQDC